MPAYETRKFGEIIQNIRTWFRTRHSEEKEKTYVLCMHVCVRAGKEERECRRMQNQSAAYVSDTLRLSDKKSSQIKIETTNTLSANNLIQTY